MQGVARAVTECVSGRGSCVEGCGCCIEKGGVPTFLYGRVDERGVCGREDERLCLWKGQRTCG